MLEQNDRCDNLYGRPRAFVVFISSKMAGGALAAEREAAIAAVAEFRPARSWAWEKDAPAGSFYSEEECVERARTSDALVLIVEDELTPLALMTSTNCRRSSTKASRIRIALRSGRRRRRGSRRGASAARTSCGRS